MRESLQFQDFYCLKLGVRVSRFFQVLLLVLRLFFSSHYLSSVKVFLGLSTIPLPVAILVPPVPLLVEGVVVEGGGGVEVLSGRTRLLLFSTVELVDSGTAIVRYYL
jgi:hypothetical protein